MVRFLGAACAVLLGCFSIAQAATPSIVITVNDPQELQAKLVNAAEKVCAEARAHDVFDDFGSQDECVSDTIQTSLRRTVDRAAAGSQDVATAK